MRLLTLLFTAALLLPAQSVRLVRISTGLASPTEIVQPRGDSRLFVVEQRGRIRILKDGAVLETPFLDIASRMSCCGERGLLGLAFPQQFASRQRFYVYYTDPAGNIVISRFGLSATSADLADPASEEVVLRVAHTEFANHNGGRIVFGPDGYLYAGLGDGGSGGDPRGNGQNLNALLGKLLRLDVEGGSATYTSPASNPFANRTGARPEIWAYGLRNPWKFSFDSATGDLYIADVGQNAIEEINFQPASSSGGQNYGWNRTEGTQCYNPRSGCDRSGITFPVQEYPHSLGVSITGGYVWRGAYIYGDYGSGRIWSLRRSGDTWQNELLLSSGLQVSTFGQDSAGELYVGSYTEGAVYRMVPTAGTIAAVNAASFGEGAVPGSLVSLFGPGIAPVIGVLRAAAFPLPASLGNVSVTMNGIRSPILAVASVAGQDQINVQVPWELAGQQRATLVVTVNGQARPSVEIPIAVAQPEIFAVQRQPEAWTIWATGLGGVSNAPGTGEAAPASPLARTTGDTRVTIGGVDATVTYSGLSPSFAGLYQVNVTPPPGVAAGAEVVLRVGSAVSKPWLR
ncbi:MAG: PQQ-dependent sugar dehydrogenase [Bryobacteraceae bacterium]|nr:PQQ-dependent sugar dehydrogenase [Bryobacteraceae bacterium]